MIALTVNRCVTPRPDNRAGEPARTSHLRDGPSEPRLSATRNVPVGRIVFR